MKKTLLIVGAFLLAQVIAGIIIALPQIIEIASQTASQTATPATDIEVTPSSSALLWALMISDIIIIVATILICRKGFVEPFRWKMPAAKGVLFVVLSLVCTAALVVLVEVLAEWIDVPDYMADTFQSLSLSPIALWAIAVIGPLSEEVACRYGIVGSLREKNWAPWAAILLSAALFAVLHLNPSQMLVAFIIGLLLGWLYIITRSLWPCIICHVANNAVSVLIMRSNPDASPDEQTLTSFFGSGTIYTVLLCGAAVVFVLTVIALRKLALSFSDTRPKTL